MSPATTTAGRSSRSTSGRSRSSPKKPAEYQHPSTSTTKVPKLTQNATGKAQTIATPTAAGDPPTEAQAAADALAQLTDRSPDGIYRGTQGFSERALTAGLTSITTGGASSLTDLTDVTGQPGFGKSPVDDGGGTFPLTRVTTEDDLNEVLTRVASVDWHDIGAAGESPFQSQFRNIGDPWSPARYRILANSTVRLQGTVTCDDQTIADATWIPIFTLPAEAAPDYNLEFTTLTNDNAMSRMYVWADGQVVWGGYAIGPHAPVTRLPLNFLSWSTAGPAPNLTNTLAERTR